MILDSGKALPLFLATVFGALLLTSSSPAAARTVSIPPEEPKEVSLSVPIEKAPIDASPYPELGEPAGCKSLRVNRDRLVVRKGPTNKSKRRGVVREGTLLPAIERVAGPGCAGYWYRIHEDAWVCDKGVTPGDGAPWGRHLPEVPPGEITPWSYAFVREPAIEYRYAGGDLEEVREVFKGYGFAVDRRTEVYGEPYFRSVEGRLIPRRAAGITTRISDFNGVEIPPGAPWPIGWVNSRKAFVYDEPSRSKKHRLESIERYARFDVLETVKKGRRVFYRIGVDRWLSDRDVRVTTDAKRSVSVGDAERWIDVDLKQQIATAYEGDRPVYATMISSGRGGPSRTVRGEFRIWVKVAAIPMDNTDEELETEDEADGGPPEEDEARHLFSLHDVPWTQFFHENFALHGVYWHDRFGNRRSHGCVNLAPRDARWFFDWTEPRMPAGWWAIYASEGDPGTLVRTR